MGCLSGRATRICSSDSFISFTNYTSGHDLHSKTPRRFDKHQTPTPAQPGSLEQHNQKQHKARRRTRRRPQQSSLAKDGSSTIPTLADFIYRAKALKQYRNFVRLAHFVDKEDKSKNKTALGEVRLSYRMSTKKKMDDLAKNMAFAEGERRLRETEAMVGYSSTELSRDTNPQSFDQDSWINIKDEDDQRGRVGVQWPWDKS